ncbi:MAG: response regulator transcription factor [Anaerolineae bacterium]|nr:response regulator transcription factor [Anaerolineae bacterium]MBN8618552.1 response regulator transcription factor [Anaerolineae bacterium]
MTYIIAVDDDPEVLGTLERVLARESFEVGLARSAAEALVKIEERTPAAMILDIMMPGMDGITFCRQLRRDARFAALPILFLTAKGTTEDVVDGLDAGGDDYVVKPFEFAELRARIHALLRRSTRDANGGALLQINDLQLDSDTYQVYIKGSSIQLTSTEHRLLRYLMENPNRALSPSHLLQAVWEYPPNTGDPDLVRAHVRNLRSKIEKNADRRYIRTIHGVGYMISL